MKQTAKTLLKVLRRSYPGFDYLVYLRAPNQNKAIITLKSKTIQFSRSRGTRTPEVVRQGFYRPQQLPLCNTPFLSVRGESNPYRPRTPVLQTGKQTNCSTHRFNFCGSEGIRTSCDTLHTFNASIMCVPFHRD